MSQGVGLSYKQQPPTGAYDAIVISSGMGGLAAAAVLAKHGGKRVLVLERHYTPGGYTHVFRRSDYKWDVGLHYIGQVHDPRSETRRVFDDITDGKLRWAPMPDVYDRVLIGDRALSRAAEPPVCAWPTTASCVPPS
jgi:all-trans-retinol 13,14-reductase